MNPSVVWGSVQCMYTVHACMHAQSMKTCTQHWRYKKSWYIRQIKSNFQDMFPMALQGHLDPNRDQDWAKDPQLWSSSGHLSPTTPSPPPWPEESCPLGWGEDDEFPPCLGQETQGEVVVLVPGEIWEERCLEKDHSGNLVNLWDLLARKEMAEQEEERELDPKDQAWTHPGAELSLPRGSSCTPEET